MNVLVSPEDLCPVQPRAIVAIPACNEADRIEACLAALATQRNGAGVPLEAGSFEILVYANNCDDATVTLAESFAKVCPHPLIVVAARLPPERSHAGFARKAAMDLAADRLEAAARLDGLILTTDADSTVSPAWISATLDALAPGIDCVAGYIDAVATEIMRLGPDFLQRSRREDKYLGLMAEIYARCDPRPHDPWPNHRVSSGASLAVTLSAYRAIGGLPAVALGEDAALTRRIEAAGLKVRRSMSVTVSTSCRFDGRAKGGAADTMRLRHEIVDAPCDDDIEPALRVLRRALLRSAMRCAHAAGLLGSPRWARRLGWPADTWTRLLDQADGQPFDTLWSDLEAESPGLKRHGPLRPADLPAQIRRAESILDRLRGPGIRVPASAPAGTFLRPDARVTEDA